MYLLIYLVAAVGVLNTQRMSAMERRREFGVMMAIGMRPRRMFRTLLVETASSGWSARPWARPPAACWPGTTPPMASTWACSRATRPSFTYMGVTFSERLHFVLTPAAVIQPSWSWSPWP
jgi:hypothetical protein